MAHSLCMFRGTRARRGDHFSVSPAVKKDTSCSAFLCLWSREKHNGCLELLETNTDEMTCARDTFRAARAFPPARSLQMFHMDFCEYVSPSPVGRQALGRCPLLVRSTHEQTKLHEFAREKEAAARTLTVRDPPGSDIHRTKLSKQVADLRGCPGT